MSQEKTSTTAFAVICGLMKLARLPQWRSYFSDEMVVLNTAFIRYSEDTLVKRLISAVSPWLFIRIMDTIYIPGMTHHFLFRKRLIADKVSYALSAGVKQVIVLGAGLDTLAIRMAPQHPTVQFFEIDLPNTQRTKTGILSHIHYPIPLNCTFIEADLAQTTLALVLHNIPTFEADAPTLVILEGVLMYLTESEVKALFAAMHTLFRDALTILFGATVASDAAGNWRIRIMNRLLRRGGEATHWFCPSAAMPEFVAKLGYTLREWIPYRKLQSYYRTIAEVRAIPEEDENYYVVVKMTHCETNSPFSPLSKTTFISVNN